MVWSGLAGLGCGYGLAVGMLWVSAVWWIGEWDGAVAGESGKEAFDGGAFGSTNPCGRSIDRCLSIGRERRSDANSTRMLFKKRDWRLQLVLKGAVWLVNTFAAARIVAIVSGSISWLIIGGEERRSCKNCEKEAQDVIENRMSYLDKKDCRVGSHDMYRVLTEAHNRRELSH